MEPYIEDTTYNAKQRIEQRIMQRVIKTILVLFVISILFFYPNLVTDQSSFIVHADYTFNIQNDYSYPKHMDYDYGLTENDIVTGTTAFSVGDTITITANIHNYGLCLASSGHGWSSSDGRSCWGEWDFYYPTSKTVDISFRCWDDVTVDWRVELDGAHLASPSVPGVGSDEYWKIVTIHDVYVSAGSHTIFLGTYQMDYKPDYRLDWVKIGDMTIEAETYDRTGGNDPNTDLRGFLITPMGTSMLESNDLTVQIWRGNPYSGGTLLKEGFVGNTNKVADTSHVYSGTSFSAYYIENNGIGQLTCQYMVQSSIEDIYVVVDSNDVLDEIDESNNIASISVRVADISINSPVSSTSWEAGSTYTITWSSENINNYVNIYLYKDGNLQQTIATNTNNDGTYTWNIPNTLPQSTNYQIKITDGTDNTIYDYSNGYFEITGSSFTLDYSNNNAILLFLGALIIIFIAISIIAFFSVKMKKRQISESNIQWNQRLIEIEKKVKEWEKEGYDVEEIEYLLKIEKTS